MWISIEWIKPEIFLFPRTDSSTGDILALPRDLEPPICKLFMAIVLAGDNCTNRLRVIL